MLKIWMTSDRIWLSSVFEMKSLSMCREWKKHCIDSIQSHFQSDTDENVNWNHKYNNLNRMKYIGRNKLIGYTQLNIKSWFVLSKMAGYKNMTRKSWRFAWLWHEYKCNKYIFLHNGKSQRDWKRKCNG